MNKLGFCFLLFPFIAFAEVKLESIEVSGFGVSEDLVGIASEKAPVSVETHSSKTLQENRIKSANDLTLLDASLTNNYSGSGYWDSLNIRGFAVDNRTNYFRDGLRINAQTAIPIENKEAVEVIKGLGGFQTSGANPSGSINYRTKRAQEARVLRAEFTERGGYLAHLDFGEAKDKFSYRLNLLNEDIKSPFNFNDGKRDLLAAAFSYQLNSKSLLEAEIEWSQHSQQTLGAQSFWGSTRPGVDPTLNLNNQPWTKPVEFESLFYSVRYTQELANSWMMGVATGRQITKTDDRMSYPSGCQGGDWDRYCGDGSFKVYDYRSEDEERITNSGKLSLSKVFEGDITHDLSLNLRFTHQEENIGFKAENKVGSGNQNGTILPSNGSKTDTSTNLLEDNIEFFVVDNIKFSKWNFWMGGNVQNRYRTTFKNDQTQRNKSSEFFFTPWAALAHKFDFASLYLSYSQGKESWITPNKAGDYNNPGKILAQKTTHQYELGLKAKNFTTALFYLKRPRLLDSQPDFKIEGFYQQLGWENNAHFTLGNTSHDLSLMYLQVKQFASGVNGKAAPNIPDLTLRYQGVVKLPVVDLGMRVQYEASRFASYDNELSIPDWIKWDFFVEKKWSDLSLRAYVDNVFQKSFWKESPVQYGHHYLYQGAARRAGVQAAYSF